MRKEKLEIMLAKPKRLGFVHVMQKNKHAQHLGKLGGRVKSPTKSAAARANGKKGGRPRNLTESEMRKISNAAWNEAAGK
jgi:hypothetical protein